MSKTWYPMINYENCVECGVCVEHCTHGVYNEEKAPRPVVINPDNCIEGCTGCSKKCPSEAITYFGQGAVTESECGCSCDSDCEEEKLEEKEETGCGCGGSCCG